MKTKIIIGLSIVATAFILFAFGNRNEKEFNLAVDKYKVIKVNGKIVFQQSKSQMKSGDYFVDGTALTFENQYSRAAIISKTKGRFVISGNTKGRVKMLPAANNVSSRAGALINSIDVKNHFSGKYLILDKVEVEINDKVYPQNKSSFFYLSYKYNDQIIRKKLNANGSKMIIDKDELFKIDGKSIPVDNMEMSLYYREGKSSKLINAFNPVFPNSEELKIEVQIIIDEFSDKPNKVKSEEITAYLNEFYGKPQKENVSNWLAEEFDLK